MKIGIISTGGIARAIVRLFSDKPMRDPLRRLSAQSGCVLSWPNAVRQTIGVFERTLK